MVSDTSAEHLYQRLRDQSNGVHVLLDVGCGRGAHLRGTSGEDVLRALLGQGATLIGIDVDLPEQPHVVIDDLRAIDSSGHWPLEDASVDLAFCDWVLEHVTDPDKFFSECARVLRPGGRLLARTLQRWSVAGIGARVVPNRWHRPLIAILQPGMVPEDVFPTSLRCNTQKSLGSVLDRHGFDLSRYDVHTGLWGYVAGNQRLAQLVSRWESRMPRQMRQTVVLSAVRRGGAALGGASSDGLSESAWR